jgi:hypothetical protein
MSKDRPQLEPMNNITIKCRDGRRKDWKKTDKKYKQNRLSSSRALLFIPKSILEAKK